MARVTLDIEDSTHAVTLRTLLESSGHAIVDDEADVIIADRADHAVQRCVEASVLLLTTASGVPNAVAAMRNGVFGYILVPFIPGEAPIMVERAASVTSEPGAERFETLREVEDRYILHVLRSCKYRQTEAATILGIGRNTLWRRLKQLGKPHER